MSVLKWTELGQLFNPAQFSDELGGKTFAQSPQVLELEDCVRVYFSTREKDALSNKFKSHIAFVDYDKDFSRPLSVSTHEVLPLGKLGTFDEHGIFPINVLRYQDRVLGYTCGWSRRVATSVETGIGFAESFDNGRTFSKLGNGPILGASINEPFLVGDAFVKFFEGEFHMWYMFGTKWEVFEDGRAPDRVYKIGHAKSHDGINWVKEEAVQVIPDKLHCDESMALPTVEFFAGKYHMFFCYRESSDFRTNSARGYRLGYAYSTDLKEWTRDDAKGGMSELGESWDSEMRCYPHLTKVNGAIYLLFNGNKFGRDGFGGVRLEM